jgi:hypothetical protein
MLSPPPGSGGGETSTGLQVNLVSGACGLVISDQGLLGAPWNALLWMGC